MRSMLVLVLLVLTFTGFSQGDTCLETILKQKGTWTMNKNPQSSTPSELALQKVLINASHEMVINAFSPVGVNMKWGGVYPAYRKEQPVADFYYSGWAFPYLCQKDGSITVDGHFNTSYDIGFNSFSDAVLYDTVEIGQRSEGFFNLRHGIPVEISNGIWAFPDKTVSLGMGIPGKYRLWLITYDGKLPWSYVTRKEFLLKRKRALQLQEENDLKNAKEKLVSLEQVKKLQEQEYKDDPVKMEKYMKGTWTPMYENYEKILAKIEPDFERVFETLDEQLAAPETDLSKNAIVIPSRQNIYDFSFTEKDEPFALILIKPNPAYFRSYPLKSVPQFISVGLTWAHQNPVLTNFAKEINPVLDLDFLKTMIGKSTFTGKPSGKGNAYAPPVQGAGSDVQDDYFPVRK